MLEYVGLTIYVYPILFIHVNYFAKETHDGNTSKGRPEAYVVTVAHYAGHHYLWFRYFYFFPVDDLFMNIGKDNIYCLWNNNDIKPDPVTSDYVACGHMTD